MIAYVDAPHHARRRSLRLAGLAVVAAAALAGWLLGSRPGPEPVLPDTGRAVAVGSATIHVPADWSPSGGPGSFATVPGLPARATLVLGAPAAVVARLELPPLRRMAPGRRAEVANREAWTYAPVQIGGVRHQLTVVPTSAGMLGIDCWAPVWAWSAALGCQMAIERVGPAGLPSPGASGAVAFRFALRDQLRALDRTRVAERSELRSVTSRGARAAALARLAAAHRAAAASLAPVAVERSSIELVRALRDQARAYGALRRAVRQVRPGPYRRAAQRLERSDAALRALLT